MENKKNKRTILKIIGPILLIAGIIMSVIGFSSFGNSSSFDGIINNGNNIYNNFGGSANSTVLFSVGGIAAIIGLMLTAVGFAPQILKSQIRLQKNIMAENKEDLKEIADISADIHYSAVEKTASAISNGFNQSKTEDKTQQPLEPATNSDATNTKFCSNCGKKINKHSKYCRHCGTNVE